MIQEFLNTSITLPLFFFIIGAILILFLLWLTYNIGKNTGRTKRTMRRFLSSVPSQTIIRINFLGYRTPPDDLIALQAFHVQILKMVNDKDFRVIHDEVVDHWFKRDNPSRTGRFDHETGTYKVTFDDKEEPILLKMLLEKKK